MDVRTAGTEAFERLLRAFESHDTQRVLDALTPDAHFEAPYIGLVISPPEIERRIMRSVRAMVGLRFTDLSVEPLQRTGGFLARYNASSTISTTGRPYIQSYFSLFDIDGGRVSRFLETFDTAKFYAAFDIQPTG